MSLLTTNKLYIQAVEIAKKHNAEIQELPDFFWGISNPDIKFALKIKVPRVGVTRRERMSHPLGSELISTFTIKNKDEKRRRLKVEDWSRVSCGHQGDHKVYILHLRY